MTLPSLQAEQLRAKQRVTLVGGVVNLLLAVGKIAAGYYGRSGALIVDGVHSFSDLATDLLILFTVRFAGQSADESHPYGHGRFETLATVALGGFLAAVAAGIVWDAAQRLQGTAPLWHPNRWALIAVGVSILVKEGLYHYTLRVARHTRSKLLRANAWHHRSDAVSSVVVLVGVIGVLAGYHFADAVAAIVVGLMIAKIGLELIVESLRELVDTALPAEQVIKIQTAIRSTEGVKSLHALRSRRMAGEALVDVHIQVHPQISVSEGHAIADRVRDRLLQEFDEVTDVVVHIDAENDLQQHPQDLPLRPRVIELLHQAWQHLPYAQEIQRINLHYLGGKIDVEAYLPLSILSSGRSAHAIHQELRKAAKPFSFVGKVQIYFTPPRSERTK
ncbi:MAG: cation transporter [Methylothermaceae bacterium]|nr:cation transporter [Methylothermaceae bacterium]